MSTIVINERSKDGLIEEKWVFWFHERSKKLVLDKYSLCEIEQKRGRIKTYQKRVYDRLFKKESNITSSDVPLPEHVKKQAVQLYIDGISVELWDNVDH